MKLSENIRARQEDAFPAQVAECHVNRLHNWEVAAATLEQTADRWRTTAHVFAAVIVGLLIALMYAAVRAPIPIPATPATNVMQLDPMTIRDRSAETIEI